jgi:hypothetical protein
LKNQKIINGVITILLTRLIGDFLCQICYADHEPTRKGGENMADQTDSKTIKAGTKTYFFDLKKTKEDKPYLTITESRFMGEGKDRERASLVVFPDHAQAFSEAIQEMVKKLG